MLPLSLKAASLVVRNAVDVESISVKSVTVNNGTRTGEFMRVDMLASWIELDHAISEESRAFILTPSNILRINFVARRMESRSFDKVSGPQLRNDLRELSRDLYSAHIGRRVKDRMRYLNAKKIESISTVEKALNGAHNVHQIHKSILDTNINYAADAVEENDDDEEVTPERRDVDALLLRCSHICESIARHPDLRQEDRNMIMNPTVVGWMESLRRRRAALLQSAIKSDHTGLCYDLTAFMSIITDFLALVVRERNVSTELSESRDRDLAAIREAVCAAGAVETGTHCSCIVS